MSLKLSSFLFLLTTPFLGYAQIRLTGRITDNKNQPIEFANVFLSNSKGKLITGTTTDKQGHFRLSAKKGTYILRVSFVGYSDYKNEIVLDKDKSLGFIVLKEATDKLKGVVVTAKKRLIEQKVDRLVFNVENSIAASGGDALDALKVTPRVRVQNDQISMIGKGSMRVMVNDRIIPLTGEDLVNYLRSISSDDIKSIEVITNPPAKYSAEGNSGLINIKLKKVRKDYWNITIRTSYKQATYPMGIFGGGFVYQKNKLSIFSDINYKKGSSAPIERNKIYYPKQLWSSENNIHNRINYLSYKLGADYQISKKIKAGLQYIGYANKPTREGNSRTALINNIATQAIDSLIMVKSTNDKKKIYNSLNAHLIYDIDSLGKVFSVDFDYFKYKSDNDRTFYSNNYLTDKKIIPNSFFSGQNIGNQNISNYAVTLDMEHPLKKLTLNYGGKLSFTRTDNAVVFNNRTTGVPIIDQLQSNTFEYRENSQALYASVQTDITDKLSAKVGLRMENTQTKGKSFTLNQLDKNSYLEFFPTAYLSYSPNKNNDFSLNYGRRIDRPDFSSLNPFRTYQSNYFYWEGNPQLKPSFTHNIELNYTYKGIWINALYFSKLKNGFGDVILVDNTTNIQKVLNENFKQINRVGLYESVTLKLFHWLSTNIITNTYYTDAKSSIPVTNQSLRGWRSENIINNDFVLREDKNMLFNVSYTFVSGGVTNLYEAKHFSQLNVLLKLLFLDKNLKITLTGNNILKTNEQEYIGYSNNIKTSFKNYYDDRYFRISLIYNLGGKIKVNQRKIKNQEEKNRLN